MLRKHGTYRNEKEVFPQRNMFIKYLGFDLDYAEVGDRLHSNFFCSKRVIWRAINKLSL